jgi:hypothetical protein
MKAQIHTDEFFLNSLPYELLRGWNDFNEGDAHRWIFDELLWPQIQEMIINNFIEELEELFENRKSFDNEQD